MIVILIQNDIFITYKPLSVANMSNSVKNPMRPSGSENSSGNLARVVSGNGSGEKLSKDESTVVVCSLVWLLLFFIIGVTTISYGCNPNSGSSCSNFISMPNAEVYKTEILLTQCRTCYSRNKHGDCTYWYYYDCYNGFVYYHLSGNKSTTCYKEVAYHDDKDEVESEMKKYKIGQDADLLKRKGSEECITPLEAKTNWVVGVVFLSFMGCCGLMTIIAISNFWYRTYISKLPICSIMNSQFAYVTNRLSSCGASITTDSNDWRTYVTNKFGSCTASITTFFTNVANCCKKSSDKKKLTKKQKKTNKAYPPVANMV